MKVVFRVDASVHIGSGHVMRCIVLAKALQRHNATVSFVCLPLPGDMRSYIEQQGFVVHTLIPPHIIVEPDHSADYKCWLQRSPDEDAKDFLNVISATDWVITDHYAIDEKWQRAVQSVLECRILAIDDLVRVHLADIVVDQTLNRVSSEYHSAGVALTGTKYALLDCQYSEKRSHLKTRELGDGEIRALISMGGIDAPNASLKVLNALENIPRLEGTVLLSERSPHFYRVKTWCENKARFKHIAFTDVMADMMLNHDIAIGAPGSTSWERACLGLPSIIVPLAENQHEISRQLVAEGASIQVNFDDIAQELPAAVYRLLDHWDKFVATNLSLCDGRGVERVLKKIMEVNRENHTVM